MSLFWSQWMPQFYNENAVKWLVKDWKVNVIRAAMAVDRGGYLAWPREESEKIYAVIEAAVKEGIYVIVDWHAELGDVNQFRNASKRFFGKLAKDVGHLPNVLFETWNEPPVGSWLTTKAYHEEILPLIREHSNNIVILGTASWSQDVDIAADNQVIGENLAYTLHFYSATHYQHYMDKANYAIGKGLTLFITEWGTCESTGNGNLDFENATKWMTWAKKHYIGNTSWSIADKNESCAALLAGASGEGNWPLSMLSKNGKWLRKYLRNDLENDLPVPEPEPRPPCSDDIDVMCCSWDGGNNCSPTTSYCAEKRMHCEDHCGGMWISNNNNNNKQETPSGVGCVPPRPSEGCCSWNFGESCGNSGTYCKSSRENCEGTCKGIWLVDSKPLPAPKGCCTWDSGESCSDDSFCKANKNNCEGKCSGRWIEKK